MNSFINDLKTEFGGKKVFITGNTGFKGSWLSKWLIELGAIVAGYSDEKLTEPSLYEELQLDSLINQFTGEITDFAALQTSISEFQPDYIFHLAAQSIVATSIDNPLETFRTNTLGTVTLLEVIRTCNFKGVAVLITSDKCYENDERVEGYSEDDRMGGKDPYSASKGAAELAIAAYARTFFTGNDKPRIGIGRAGNVIGGGDWNENRIIVDCVKAWQAGNQVELRNPNSTRPWQHVLEPLSGYLCLAIELSRGKVSTGEAFNFGPVSEQGFTVNEIVQKLIARWPNCPGMIITKDPTNQNIPEAKLLSLNCNKSKRILGWQSSLEIEDCLDFIAEWYLARINKSNLNQLTSKQISDYISKISWSLK